MRPVSHSRSTQFPELTGFRCQARDRKPTRPLSPSPPPEEKDDKRKHTATGRGSKRKKKHLPCSSCREKHQRCDGLRPCQACLKEGRPCVEERELRGKTSFRYANLD